MTRLLGALTLSGALALSTSAVHAGGLADAIIEEPVVMVDPVVEETGSSGWIIPAIIVAALIAVAMSGDDEECIRCESDSRLKTDITLIGSSPSGLPIYTFRYVWSDQLYEGTMAQDVLLRHPEAVHTHPFGYLQVDYSQIDVTMRAIN